MKLNRNCWKSINIGKYVIVKICCILWGCWARFKQMECNNHNINKSEQLMAQHPLLVSGPEDGSSASILSFIEAI